MRSHGMLSVISCFEHVISSGFLCRADDVQAHAVGILDQDQPWMAAEELPRFAYFCVTVDRLNEAQHTFANRLL